MKIFWAELWFNHVHVIPVSVSHTYITSKFKNVEFEAQLVLKHNHCFEEIYNDFNFYLFIKCTVSIFENENYVHESTGRVTNNDSRQGASFNVNTITFFAKSQCCCHSALPLKHTAYCNNWSAMEMHVCELCGLFHTRNGLLRINMTRTQGGAYNSVNAETDHHASMNSSSNISRVWFDHVLVKAPIQFTSDAVCNDFFKFFANFSDDTTEILSTTPKLPASLSTLLSECRLCVQYVCNRNLTTE